MIGRMVRMERGRHALSCLQAPTIMLMYSGFKLKNSICCGVTVIFRLFELLCRPVVCTRFFRDGEHKSNPIRTRDIKYTKSFRPRRRRDVLELGSETRPRRCSSRDVWWKVKTVKQWAQLNFQALSVFNVVGRVFYMAKLVVVITDIIYIIMYKQQANWPSFCVQHMNSRARNTPYWLIVMRHFFCRKQSATLLSGLQSINKAIKIFVKRYILYRQIALLFACFDWYSEC